jgi:signal transduction histidine kinase
MWRSRLSLQVNAFLLIGLVGVIVAVVFGFLGIRAVRQSTDQALEQRLVLAQATAGQIDYLLQHSLDHLAAGSEEELRELMGSAAVARPNVSQMYAFQKQNLPILPAFVCILDAEGRVLACEPRIPDVQRTDFSRQPYVRRALREARPVVSGVVRDVVEGLSLVFLASPIRSDSGEAVGLVQTAVDLAVADLGVWVQPLALGETGFGQIVDANGFVLASTEPGHLLQRAEHSPQFASLIAKGASTMGRCHSCHEGAPKREDILAFAPLTSAPWGVAIQQSEAEAFAPSRWLRRQHLILGSVALLTALVGAWLIARGIARPVRGLASASRRIAEGDLETPVVPRGPAELYSLAESFETMRSSLTAWHGKVARWQEDLEHRVSDRTKDLVSLIRASEALISSLEPDKVLRSTVESAVNAFGADAGTLFLWDPDEKCLLAKAAVGYEERSLSRVRLRPGEAIAGRAFLESQTLYSNDPAQARALLLDVSEEMRHALLAARDGREIHAYLCVPLIFRDQAHGSLFLTYLRPGVAFTRSHLEVAQTFARMASALLGNVRLLQEASEAEALRQADRLKDDFISNISHELQTPLASLKASIGFLSPPNPGATETQAMLLENARRNTERLQRLVTDLIDVSRLQNLQLKLHLDAMDLRQLVNLAGESFSPLMAEKSQVLELFAPERPMVVHGDHQRLEQVLNNLLMNAQQHTPEGGRVTVHLWEDGERAVVAVKDNGPGIPPEERCHLFERFYRGSSSSDHLGLGLGLSIAKGLVELHGGRLWAESTPGQESVFLFSLPKRRSDEDSGY